MVKSEVEACSLAEVQEALDAKADIIMLDNRDCDTMRKAVALTNGRAGLEASGGITRETLRAVAETGVEMCIRDRSNVPKRGGKFCDPGTIHPAGAQKI